MRKQAAKVLAHLQRVGSDTDTTIALYCDCPPASVRRSIQELIHEDVPISYAMESGYYTLAREA